VETANESGCFIMNGIVEVQDQFYNANKTTKCLLFGSIQITKPTMARSQSESDEN
jgi:hypothetical protein